MDEDVSTSTTDQLLDELERRLNAVENARHQTDQRLAVLEDRTNRMAETLQRMLLAGQAAP